MPIEVRTVYTKEMLMRFNDFLGLRKRALWLLMLAGTALMLYLYIYATVTTGYNAKLTLYMVLLLLWDGLFVFLTFGLPRLTVKKAKNLNAEIRYSFTKEHIEIHAVSQYGTDHSTAQYNLINTALKSKQYLYLMVGLSQGFVVDLSQLPAPQVAQLRQLLESRLPARKCKWKD